MTTGWYETDVASGYTTVVLPSGEHSGFFEYVGTLSTSKQLALGLYLGLIGGGLNGGFLTILDVADPRLAKLLKAGEAIAAKVIFDLIKDKNKLASPFLIVFAGAFAFGTLAMLYLAHIDPETPPVLFNPNPTLPTVANAAKQTEPIDATILGGRVVGSPTTSSVRLSGALSAAWAGAGTNAFQLAAFSAPSATVTDAAGNAVGTGPAALTATAAARAVVTGSAAFVVTGTGSLSTYAVAGGGLGVAGEWANYSGSVTGDVTVTLTTDGLTLNGTRLPAGTYTVVTKAATFAGNGATSSPNFAGAVSVTVTNGSVDLGSGSGTLSVGGAALDPATQTTFTGYSGTVGVAAGGGTDPDAVTLDGTAGNVLRVTTPPARVTADQNTPATFQVNIDTSLADTFTISAQAPDGWAVAVSVAGVVTVTPAAGTQAGAYPVRVVVTSQSNAALVAQTTVTVAVTPTAPGSALDVSPDALFTVPYSGAQLPTAFRATVRNLGPAADTYTVTASNAPAGLTLLTSGNGVTVPAGQAGVLGLYLQPTPGTPLPSPGTVLTFTVTATSTADPTVTKTQLVSFTMPEVRALFVTPQGNPLTISPGNVASAQYNVTNAGNVTENVTVATTAPAGLTADVTGVTSLTVPPGDSSYAVLFVTVDAAAALNTTLTATLTATSGPAAAPVTQAIPIPVRVGTPASDVLTGAAFTASAAGLTDLAARLTDLADALTRLYLAPSDPLARAQSLAAFDAVAGFAVTDPFLAAFNAVPDFQNSLSSLRSQLALAGTQAVLNNLNYAISGAVQAVARTKADELEYSFTATLSPNTGVFTPNAPTVVLIDLTDTGRQPVTINLATPDTLGKLYGVTATFNHSTVSLQPGETLFGGSANGVRLTLTPDLTHTTTFGYSVTARVQQGFVLSRTLTGSLTPRPELVAVTSVAPAPAFAAPGTPVRVTAQVLAAVNTPRTATATLTVTSPAGAVVFTATAPVALGFISTLAPVTFAPIDTAALAAGDYALAVVLTEADGTPIAGGTATGRLPVGLPVAGAIATTPAAVLLGNSTVTTSVTLSARSAFASPLTLTGQVATTLSSQSVALVGTLAYVAGSNGVDIVDVSDPTGPKLVRTFAANLIVRGGIGVARRLGAGKLLVASTTGNNPSGYTLLVFDLADPLNPAFVSATPVNFRILSDVAVQGGTALVTTGGFLYSPLSGYLFDQIGDVVALDLTDPAAPAVKGVLYGTRNRPDSGDTNQGGLAAVAPGLALVASSSSRGDQFQAGTGRVLVTDFSNPAHLSVAKEVPIPGTNHAVALGVQESVALVLGSTGGWNATQPFGLTGHPTLTALDTSDPRNPVVLGSTLVLDGDFPAAGRASILPLGGGKFAVSGLVAGGGPALLIVDAADPARLAVAAVGTPTPVSEMAASGNLLYTTSDSGLLVYTLGAVAADPVTVSVRVPTGGGVAVVPGSFNLPPTRTAHAAGFDTFEWDRTLAFGLSTPTFRFQSAVTGLTAAEARPVAAGGTVTFTVGGTAAAFDLPGTVVTAAQALTMTPAGRSVVAGTPATFTVTVAAPPEGDGFYSLSVSGLPAGWVSIPFGVNLTVGQSRGVTLTVTPPGDATLGPLAFVVTAVGPGNRGYDALGVVTVTAPAAPDPASHGAVVTLTPATATAGQGTPARFVVRVTNAGSAPETYALTAGGLPAGAAALFTQNGTAVTSVAVPPGAGNSREVVLTLTPAAGTPPRGAPFTVTAAAPKATATAAGTLTVAAAGVALALDRPSGAPGDTFQLTVTNTGVAADTFDLAAGGPAGLVAGLGAPAVTLAPGQSAVVPVTTTGAAFAAPGPLRLMLVARSQADPSVSAGARADLAVAPSAGLAAAANPASQSRAAPGPADFAVTVSNTGNAEDSYSATITGVSGPVFAALVGLDGTDTQSVPDFRLPGLSSGTLRVHSTLTGPGTGTVTVTIRSLTDPAHVSVVTASAAADATVSPPAPPPLVPPVTPPVVPPVTPPVVPPVVPPAAPPVVPVTVPPIPPPVASPVVPVLPPPARRQIYAVGAGLGGGPRVQVYDAATDVKLRDFFAYDSSLRGGVSVATGDVNGDGIDDLITGAGFGGAAHVEVFDGATGVLLASWFAYDSTFRGGVWVAVADLDGDGRADIVTGPGAGGGPLVEVWSLAGGVPRLTSSFLAFEPDFRGGATVAAWVGADGVGVIAAGAGQGGGPRVRTFAAATLTPLTDAFVYEPSFAGGVAVASGGLLGGGVELLVAPGAGGGPRLRAFAADGTPLGDTLVAAGDLRAGLTVAALGREGGHPEVLFGAGEGVRRGTFAGGLLVGAARIDFFEDSFAGGVFVG